MSDRSELYMPGATILPMSGFFQLAYVTDDLDKALHGFRADHGIEHFLVTETDFTHRSPSGPTRVRNRMAFAWAGQTQIEVIQPLGDSQTLFYDPDHLDADTPFVFHHLGMLIRKHEEWLAFRRSIEEAATPIHLECSVDAGHWLYCGDRWRLGHYFEYMWLGEEGLHNMFELVPRN